MNVVKTGMTCLVILSAWIAQPSWAEDASSDVSLTIYNDNFAVVRDQRPILFQSGLNTMKFTDVASRIDPTSVGFKCLEAPEAIRILEQNYEYDLVSTESLLKRYIDKDISVNIRGAGSSGGRIVEGKLSAATGGALILELPSGEIEIINPGSAEGISLMEKPDDLVTRPTLVWLAAAKEQGQKKCEVTYTTEGIGWKADYLATISDDEKRLELSAWVTIDNQSGTAYNDAVIKLIAGDVQRIQPVRMEKRRSYAESVIVNESTTGAFEEQSFMEYHLYTLGRKSTINNRQVKQIELFEPVANIPAVKRYVYDASIEPWRINRNGNTQGKVQVKIEFENTKENGLGIALPKGKIRTFKANPNDKALEFVGEDMIDHTPKKEKISLNIGNAFDVVVEDRIKDQKNRGNDWRKITREVKIKNRKDEAVEVYVDEWLPRYWNWTISDSTVKHEKLSAEKARFAVPVQADSEVILEYTFTLSK